MTPDALSDAVQRAEQAGTLVISGAVQGGGFSVDLDDDASLRTLLSAAGTCYVTTVHWDETTREFLLEAVEDPTALNAAMDEHPIEDGRLVSQTVQVVHGGVLHHASAVEEPFAVILEEQQRQQRREEGRWLREETQARRDYREHVQRVERVVEWIRRSLTVGLLADDTWMTLGSERARLLHARNLVARQHPDVAGEQKVATAIRDVVTEATRVRDDEVVPARISHFLSNIEEHAAVCSERSAGARTKAEKRLVVEAYVREVDAVVPVHQVREPLLDAAMQV